MADEVYIDSKAPSLESQWLLNNERAKHLGEISKINDEHIREIINMKDAHQREKDDIIIGYMAKIYDAKIATQDLKTELIRTMSEKAIDKALDSMNDRQELSNNKFGLLKDQNTEAELKYAHKSELKAMEEKNQIRYEATQKQIAVLARIASIGIGIVLALQFLIPIALKFIK